MEELKSGLLGIIQGLTEFLPVSSSGHIELGKKVLDTNYEESILFSVVVHAATALSTIIIFRKDIAVLLKELFQFKWNTSTKYICMIALSSLPVAIVGVLWKDEIKAYCYGNILLVGCMLLATGALLSFTYYSKPREGKISFLKAIPIGIAQAIAVLPGISRSGATISTSLLLGIEKEEAAKFSFLMVLVPIFGMAALEIKEYMEVAGTADVVEISNTSLIIGFITAFISGLFACKWMIKLVKKGKLIYFAYYCFVVGIVAIIYSLV